MTTFRVEKNKNYTVMSNYHLRDSRASLKTKGLLSVMLSLPDDWDYTEMGLVKITGEGRSAIRACLKQLEDLGYLEREQSRDNRGRMSKSIYVIYEVPKTPAKDTKSPLFDFPTTVNPTAEKPTADNSTAEKPTSENQTEINTKEIKNTEKQNTESINHSSSNDKIDGLETYDRVEKILKENVGFDIFVSKAEQVEQKFEDGLMSVDEFDEMMCEYNPDTAARVLQYMTDLVAGKNVSPTVMINGVEIPADVVKSKLLKVDFTQFKKVVKELCVNPTIKNQKKYAISMLYNS